MGSIEEAVRFLGKRHHRTDEDVELITARLLQNWVSTLDHWRELSAEKRKDLALPALLVQELDNLAEEFVRSKQIPTVSPPSTAQSLPVSQTILDAGAKKVEGEEAKAQTELFCCYVKKTSSSAVECTIDDREYRFKKNSHLRDFLAKLGEGSSLHSEQGVVHPSTKLAIALVPGRKLVTPERTFVIRAYEPYKAVYTWLKSLGLEKKYSGVFVQNGIDDFLVLPFLRSNVLDDMGIAHEDKRKILQAVKTLQDSSPSEFFGMWIQYLGFGRYVENFMRHKIDLRVLGFIKEKHLEEIGIRDPADRARLYDTLSHSREFTSVEATFAWLRANNLDHDAFQFARYNIPFYALPLVNFFIIHHMGVPRDDRKLIDALERLKTSPAYAVKAMAYWLRDLELEHYSLLFARTLMVDFIESLTILNDHTINRLVPASCPGDREKLKAAVRDLKEFQLYYTSTKALLQELIFEKFAQIFAEHNVTFDILPRLDEDKLLSMGISNAADRKRVLAAVKRIREDLPPAALRILTASSKGSNGSSNGNTTGVFPFLSANSLGAVPYGGYGSNSLGYHLPNGGLVGLPDPSWMVSDGASAASRRRYAGSPPAFSPVASGAGSPPLASGPTTKLRELVAIGSPLQMFGSSGGVWFGPHSGPLEEDRRSVDELLSFINNAPLSKGRPEMRRNSLVDNSLSNARSAASSAPAKPSKAGKRLRQKERKRRAKAEKKKAGKPAAESEEPATALSSSPEATAPQASPSEPASPVAEPQPLPTLQPGEADVSLDALEASEDLEPEDDELDPELRAVLDREVEEFRMRLEAINQNGARKPFPANSLGTTRVMLSAASSG